MLDSDTKRRIDTARDILVGKVPDPKSQVEQITIALIYKFMDDMDAESEEMGGKRKFFTGDFARYGWAKLMRAGLGGHETLNLYAEGITKMPENPGIPPLFRDIFKNAYLPYRDPETLKAFLKIINEFNYDHSERLGEPKAWVTDNALYVKELLKPVDLKFLEQALRNLNLNSYAKVGGQPSISQSTVLERKIALPNLDTQRSIVAEIEAEQALVAANRELIARFEQKIQSTLARIWGEKSEIEGTA